MAPSLKISSNNASNPLTLDLSNYLDLTDGSDMDPQNPSFSSKVISHSLLKEGGVLALEDFQNKELVFPLRISQASSSALATLIEQINQVVTSAGATYSWQDSGMSQPTIFDAISGEFDVKYRYRESEKFWCSGDLKLFTQPFGRTAGPRAYAAASGVAPLLMITPYSQASPGVLAIGASTQNGIAGFGGRPAGASTGVFYYGSPSLSGDMGAQLKISACMTVPLGHRGTPSFAVLSLLPDPQYSPLLPLTSVGGSQYGASVHGGIVYTLAQPVSAGFPAALVSFEPETQTQGALRAGQHRMFVFARASGTSAQLSVQAAPIAAIGNPLTATIPSSLSSDHTFGLYDLGTYTATPSTPDWANSVFLYATIPSVAGVGANAAVDVCAAFAFPDATTWYLGASSPAANIDGRTLLIDDTVNWQGVANVSLTSAPSAVSDFSAYQPLSVAAYSRGLVPRPDPKNGLPVVALLTFSDPTIEFFQQLSAQVAVQERSRYVLP